VTRLLFHYKAITQIAYRPTKV